MKRYEVIKVNTYLLDVEELACKILGLDYDEIEGDTEIIERELTLQLNVDLVDFQDIVNRLLPLIAVGESPLVGTTCKGFSNGTMWLVKIPV